MRVSRKNRRELSLAAVVLVLMWVLAEGINGNLPQVATYNDERLLKDELEVSNKNG